VDAQYGGLVAAGSESCTRDVAKPRGIHWSLRLSPEHNGFHGLFLAAVPEAKIFELAADAGWPAARVPNGPFDVINVWVEARQLLEFTTPELYPAYKATFDTDGVTTLDAGLRVLECELSQQMSLHS
jgi:hypothetical protein